MHLPIEFPLDPNGHRPVNERFRVLSDQHLLRVLKEELKIPVHVIGGSMEERLSAIADVFGFPRVISIEEAISRAQSDYALLDTRIEKKRAAAVGRV